MSLEQIGQKLKNARETQGLTLRQIYERTKIPLGHLQSIDNGLSEDLPEPVYVAGFIKRYADCVGLNGQGLSEEYRRASEEKPGNGHHHPLGRVIVAQPAYTNVDVKHLKPQTGPPTFKTIYFNALWIVIVIGLVSYLSMTQFNNMANQQDPSLLALRDSTAKYNINNQVPNATTMPGAVDTTKTNHVSLSASQHVWVEIKSLSSGESLFTGYMEQGDRRDFQDAQGVSVRAGNGGSLTYEFQGQSQTLGEAGKVAERSFMFKQATAENDPAKDTKTSPAQSAQTTTKKWTKRTPATKTSSEGSRASRYRNVDDVPARQYIPGESLGSDGRRSLDVPYRYSEGRLDAE